MFAQGFTISTRKRRINFDFTFERGRIEKGIEGKGKHDTTVISTLKSRDFARYFVLTNAVQWS